MLVNWLSRNELGVSRAILAARSMKPCDLSSGSARATSAPNARISM
eukprot:COSAG02_NODE_46937_length_345_cov_0.605691_1_plen_45_part_10